MNSVTFTILLAFSAQAELATKDANDAHDFNGKFVKYLADKLVNKLFDRALNLSPLNNAEVDDTVLGKASVPTTLGRVAVSSPLTIRAPASLVQGLPSRPLSYPFMIVGTPLGSSARPGANVVAQAAVAPPEPGTDIHPIWEKIQDLNKAGSLAREISWNKVGEQMTRVGYNHSMILLKDLEGEGKEVLNPAKWIQKATTRIENGATSPFKKGTKLSQRIRVINNHRGAEGNGLAKPIHYFRVRPILEELEKLKPGEAFTLLDELETQGKDVVNPTLFLAQKAVKEIYAITGNPSSEKALGFRKLVPDPDDFFSNNPWLLRYKYKR